MESSLKRDLQDAKFWDLPYCLSCREALGEDEEDDHAECVVVPAGLLFDFLAEVEREGEDETDVEDG